MLFQAECVIRSAEQVTAALNAQDVEAVFYGLHNLLAAAGNMSKALSGQTGEAVVADARQPLRDSIGIDDESPLRDVRMRNNFEHFDERLDQWWVKSPNHNYIDMNIGPASIFGADRLAIFRSFNPRSGSVAV